MTSPLKLLGQLLQTPGPLRAKRHKRFKGSLNYDPALTLTNFAEVKFGHLCFCMGKKCKLFIYWKLLQPMISKLAFAFNLIK